MSTIFILFDIVYYIYIAWQLAKISTILLIICHIADFLVEFFKALSYELE